MTIDNLQDARRIYREQHAEPNYTFSVILSIFSDHYQKVCYGDSCAREGRGPKDEQEQPHQGTG